MSIPLIDAYRAVNALKEAGLTADQARALVDAVGGAMTGGLATKADVARIRADIAGLRSDLRSGLAEPKAYGAKSKADPNRDMWFFVMGVVVLTVGLIVTLVKTLP